MLEMVDVHHHISDSIPVDGIYNCYTMSHIRYLKAINSRHISIGIHPLYIEDDIDWVLVESTLHQYKNINIGEVGLDRRGDNMENQLEVFKRFISLSNNYRRSISIHCVKSWGKLIEIVKDQLNPKLPQLFHGYTGSLESMKSLLDRNSYFSISRKHLNNDRVISLIESMPIEKLLIESDMLNSDYRTLGERAYLDSLNSTYKIISAIKIIPLEELVNIVLSNFNRFLGVDDNESAFFCNGV